MGVALSGAHSTQAVELDIGIQGDERMDCMSIIDDANVTESIEVESSITHNYSNPSLTNNNNSDSNISEKNDSDSDEDYIPQSKSSKRKPKSHHKASCKVTLSFLSIFPSFFFIFV